MLARQIKAGKSFALEATTLPARHSPEAKPMADGQGTSGQAFHKIATRFYPELINQSEEDKYENNNT
jgi:hypothetical protein